MNTRRITTASLSFLTCATLGLAGCHSSSSTDAGSPSSQASAKDNLMSSLASLGTTSYAISLTTPQISATGAVDPVGDTISVTARGTREGEAVKIESLTVEQSSWARIDLGTASEQMGINPSKWLRLDPSELTSASLPFDKSDLTDAFDLDHILGGIIAVTRVDAQHYSGTIDLSGVRGVNSIVPAGDSLGAAAKNLPFTATTDPRGRMTELRVGPKGGTAAFDFKISDYNVAETVDPPDDDDVVIAPKSVYGLLRVDRLTGN